MLPHLPQNQHGILAWLDAFLPPVLWAILIFFLSNQPTLPGPDIYLWDFLFKKSAHMFVYAVLYLLSYRGIYQVTHAGHPRVRLLLPFIICLLYSVSDELHQSLIPNRQPTLRDVGYDSLGMLVAFLKLNDYI